MRMRRALEEYRIVGIQTNIPFHLAVMGSIDFQRGRLDTRFLERFLSEGGLTQPDREGYAEVAAIVGALVAERRRDAGSAAISFPVNGKETVGQPGNWRLAGRRAGLR
jgi:acetyl/propionyl-CoA carboxylase alpha subunit